MGKPLGRPDCILESRGLFKYLHKEIHYTVPLGGACLILGRSWQILALVCYICLQNPHTNPSQINKKSTGVDSEKRSVSGTAPRTYRIYLFAYLLTSFDRMILHVSACIDFFWGFVNLNCPMLLHVH